MASTLHIQYDCETHDLISKIVSVPASYYTPTMITISSSKLFDGMFTSKFNDINKTSSLQSIHGIYITYISDHQAVCCIDTIVMLPNIENISTATRFTAV